MNGIQLDLFTFAAMQSQEQPIKAEPVIVPKNIGQSAPPGKMG